MQKLGGKVGKNKLEMAGALTEFAGGQRRVSARRKYNRTLAEVACYGGGESVGGFKSYRGKMIKREREVPGGGGGTKSGMKMVTGAGRFRPFGYSRETKEKDCRDAVKLGEGKKKL